MKNRRLIALASLLLFAAGTSTFADWNQWRGPNRDGAADRSPALLSELPKDGLKPAWTSDAIPSGRYGGWASPVVADGKAYLYVHSRELKPGVKPGKPKFPWLAPDKRGHLTPQQYREYEKNRRDEDEKRANAYAFYETLWCIDAKTGKTKWKTRQQSIYTRFLQSGTATVLDGRVFVLAPGRMARCFDTATGRQVWETRIPGEFRDEFMMSSFAVTDGVAAVLVGHLVALDTKTGRLLWQGHPKVTKGTHSSPAVWTDSKDPKKQGYFIVNVNGRETICVEPRTGKERWRIKSWAALSTPVLIGNQMITYGNSRRGGVRCYEVSASEATHRWTVGDIADKGSSPVVVKDHIYVQGETTLACISLTEGTLKWKTKLNVSKPQYTSPIAADGKVLYTHGGFLLFDANPKQFTPLAEASFTGDMTLQSNPKGKQRPLVCASPAFHDGRVLIRMKDRIACYDLRKHAKLSRQ